VVEANVCRKLEQKPTRNVIGSDIDHDSLWFQPFTLDVFWFTDSRDDHVGGFELLNIKDEAASVS
jgi:hypothetical protein